MRRWIWLFFLGLGALAQGRLEAGAYFQGGLFPTLAAGFALEEGEVYLRLQPGRGGLGYLGGVALGPLGYLGYGLQGEVGEGGLGGAVFLEGGAGPWPWRGGLPTVP
jgi:hypothetical protein